MESLRGNHILILVLLAVLSCSKKAQKTNDIDSGVSRVADASLSLDSGIPVQSCEDLDQDGFCATEDCNDNNAYIFPGAPEACNNINDDCDADIDEDLGTNRCGLGNCAREVLNCEAGRPKICEPGPVSPETCDGTDEDCDGDIDEDLIPSTECGRGGCRRTPSCENGRWTMCVPGVPQIETCNRIDDNCDGVVDEGFRAAYAYSTYSELSSFHSGCDGSAERIGTTCNAAMHRYCAAQDCSTSGFGPLENSGDIAHVACLQSVVHDTSYSQLAMQHGGCTGVSQRFGPDCGAAIHRQCQSLGYLSGFGPVENSGEQLSIACVSNQVATIVQATYPDLSQQHGPCNGSSERFGPNCFAAISRYCRAQGYTSGYGPVENFGDTATIFCIDP